MKFRFLIPMLSIWMLLAPAMALAQKEDAFLSGPPLTFADLTKATGAVYEGRLKAAIEKRGIAAPFTDPQAAQLRSAGASQELIDLIRKRAPAPPPPPPPPTGSLAIQCQPAECDVAINGKPAGKTSGGLLIVNGIPQGAAVVSYLKSGYTAQQQNVTVDATTARLQPVKLRPDAGTQSKAGKELLELMRKRLGKVDAIPALTLSGNAILWDQGRRTDWTVSATVNVENHGLSLEIQAAGLHWRESLKAGVNKSEGSDKLKGSGVATEVEQLARRFYDYQPSVLLARLSAPDITQLLCDLSTDPQGNRVLQAFAGSDQYAILIAPDGTPLRLHHAGLEIAYEDFTTIQGALYPRTFAVRSLSANSAPATVLRFTHAASEPSLLKRLRAADAGRDRMSLTWMWNPA